MTKYVALRFLLALAAEHGLDMLQLNVKKAFLNGKLEEEIYVEEPEGYISSETPNHVYRLYRAIYGLKQGGRT